MWNDFTGSGCLVDPERKKTLAEESLKRLLNLWKILLMSLLNKLVNKSDNYKILSWTTVTA